MPHWVCEDLRVAEDALRNALVVVRAARAWSSAKRNPLGESGRDAELRQSRKKPKEAKRERGGEQDPLSDFATVVGEAAAGE